MKTEEQREHNQELACLVDDIAFKASLLRIAEKALEDIRVLCVSSTYWNNPDYPNCARLLKQHHKIVSDAKVKAEEMRAIEYGDDGRDREAYEKAIKEIPDMDNAETQAFHTTVIKTSEERIAALELQLKALQDEMLGARVLLLENHVEAQGHCDGAICKAIREGWEDEPDRSVITERYIARVWKETAIKVHEMDTVRRIINDLIDEVTRLNMTI